MYIGKTIYPEDRFDQHLRAARNNTSNMVIHKAIRKYGPECFHFEILETYSTEEESLAGEKYWISVYDTMIGSATGGYNMTEGGENASPCEELREHLSAKTREYFSIPGNREKQSEAIRLYFQTPGAKERQSQLISAYANSPQGKIAYSEKTTKYFSLPGTREKASATHKLRFSHQEERDKVSVALKKHFECPEARQRNKDRQKEVWSNPELIEKKRQLAIKRYATPEMNAYKKLIIESYLAGMPMKDIAALVNRHWTTVRTVLIKADVYVYQKDKTK
jgi:hypothetical protein